MLIRVFFFQFKLIHRAPRIHNTTRRIRIHNATRIIRIHNNTCFNIFRNLKVLLSMLQQNEISQNFQRNCFSVCYCLDLKLVVAPLHPIGEGISCCIELTDV